MWCCNYTWVLSLSLFAAGFPDTCADSHQSRDLQALYDTDINLTCADEKFQPGSAYNATYQWLLPNGRLLSVSSAYNSRSHWTVLDDGVTLSISHVDRHVFGLYLCLVSVNGLVQTSVRWTVNINGPYYGDMWAKYWPKTKVGLMAAAAVFIFLTMLCINLDQFQHYYDKTEGDAVRRKFKSRSTDQLVSSQAYRNSAFSDVLSTHDTHTAIGSEEDIILANDTHHDNTQANMQESKTSF